MSLCAICTIVSCLGLSAKQFFLLFKHICSKSKEVLIERANAVYINFKKSRSKKKQINQNKKQLNTAKQLKKGQYV